MGHVEHTTAAGTSARGKRLGWRTCLRKGCGRRYQAWHWRQRYCREPRCLRELRRWQASRRQGKRRATAEGRQKHARAERERRQRKKSQAASPSTPVRDGARGHAIKKFPPGRFAIGPAVSNPLEPRFEPPHTTAATIAARPCVVCEIANASGSPARQRPAGGSVAWSTKRPGRNAGSVPPRAAASGRVRAKRPGTMEDNVRSASIGMRRRQR